MVGWHHWLDGHGCGWTLRIGDGQGGLACWDSWGCKEWDMTEQLNWTETLYRPCYNESALTYWLISARRLQARISWQKRGLVYFGLSPKMLEKCQILDWITDPRMWPFCFLIQSGTDLRWPKIPEWMTRVTILTEPRKRKYKSLCFIDKRLIVMV